MSDQELDMLNQGAVMAPTSGVASHDEPGVPEPTMDDVWAQSIDKDALNQTKADLLLPVGTYTTVPPFTTTMNEEVDKRSGRPAGTQARLFGQVVFTAGEREVKANEAARVRDVKIPAIKLGDVIARGSIGFAVSPLRRDKLDNDGNLQPGKPDAASKNYSQAYDAYKVAYGREPNSPADVIKYLTDFPVRLRIQQFGVPTKNRPEPDGEPGNYVAAISPVREPK